LGEERIKTKRKKLQKYRRSKIMEIRIDGRLKRKNQRNQRLYLKC
jgi:hypothetical protein